MPGIVVGFDRSSHSERALKWAAREAALHNEPLTIVAVHEPEVNYLGSTVCSTADAALTNSVRALTRKTAEAVLDRLGENAPAQVNIDVRSGSPAEELLAAAKDADLLVVGSRGAGGFAQLIMGSVSQQVTLHARCVVAVVPIEQK